MGEFFKSKKNLAGLLLFVILILAIPIGMKLLSQQKVIKSRATSEAIVFTGSNVRRVNDNVVATKPEITLQLTSPLGPPAIPSPSVSATP